MKTEGRAGTKVRDKIHSLGPSGGCSMAARAGGWAMKVEGKQGWVKAWRSSEGRLPAVLASGSAFGWL